MVTGTTGLIGSSNKREARRSGPLRCVAFLLQVHCGWLGCAGAADAGVAAGDADWRCAGGRPACNAQPGRCGARDPGPVGPAVTAERAGGLGSGGTVGATRPERAKDASGNAGYVGNQPLPGRRGVLSPRVRRIGLSARVLPTGVGAAR
jgi:hypothetical protein